MILAHFLTLDSSMVSNLAMIQRPSQKLTHYLQESNQGRGFIKEVSFSPDGRIIASPFAYGIRLLAFNSDCRFNIKIVYYFFHHSSHKVQSRGSVLEFRLGIQLKTLL